MSAAITSSCLGKFSEKREGADDPPFTPRNPYLPHQLESANMSDFAVPDNVKMVISTLSVKDQGE